MISSDIEAVLKTWSAQMRAGTFTLATFTMGCNVLQDAAARVRLLEERGGPVGCDSSEMDMEAITAHFADLIDPSPRNARLRH